MIRRADNSIHDAHSLSRLFKSVHANLLMKVLLQRVKQAEVTIDEEIVGAIYQGLLVFIGVEKNDDQKLIDKMINKILNYRIFSDSEGKMNLSVSDIDGGILAVSQFTLAADTQKGLRPSFSSAAPPQQAQELYNYFIDKLKFQYAHVATGKFAANMQVSLVNDGPVTFTFEMKN